MMHARNYGNHITKAALAVSWIKRPERVLSTELWTIQIRGVKGRGTKREFRIFIAACSCVFNCHLLQWNLNFLMYDIELGILNLGILDSEFKRNRNFPFSGVNVRSEQGEKFGHRGRGRSGIVRQRGAPGVGRGRASQRVRVQARGEGAVVGGAVRQALGRGAHLQRGAGRRARAPRPHAVAARRQPALAYPPPATQTHLIAGLLRTHLCDAASIC